jgi:hypothetical protein
MVQRIALALAAMAWTSESRFLCIGAPAKEACFLHLMLMPWSLVNALVFHH